MSDRLEWVEIIEPRTREHMYANLITGECVWNLPHGVKFKGADINQWWELYDRHTSRFYYYNATTQKTAWHRPIDCDIIPLAKLQTLKQNTEVVTGSDRKQSKRETSTQTNTAMHSLAQHPSPFLHHGAVPSPMRTPTHVNGSRSKHSKTTSHSALPSAISFTHQVAGDGAFMYPQHHIKGRDDSIVSYRGTEPYVLPERHISAAAASLYDNPLDFAIDYRALCDDSARLSAVRGRPRAFPRTNPSFISTTQGAKKLHGQQPQQQQPKPQPINIYNQQLYDNYPPPPLSLSSNQRLDSVTERRLAFRHDRSDSDTSSHTSTFGATRYLTREDSGGGAARSPQCGGARRVFKSRGGGGAGSTTSGEGQLSDGHSSAGSLRSVGRAELNVCSSSLGSLNKDSESSMHNASTTSSPSHHHQQLYIQNPQLLHSFASRKQAAGAVEMQQRAGRARHESEPDYANLSADESSAAVAVTAAEAAAVRGMGAEIRTAPARRKHLDTAGGSSRHGEPVTRASPGHNTMLSHSIVPPASAAAPDQVFEDSDSSLLSSPSPRTRQKPLSTNQNTSLTSDEQVQLANDTQDGTVRPKSDERSRPMSQLFSSQSDDDLMLSVAISDRSTKQITSLEDFVMENMNEQRRGLLGRAVSIGHLMIWTKDAITKPMIKTSDKVIKKEGPEVFKLVQTYMTDRVKSRVGQDQSSRLQVALDIVTRGWTNVELRDEIFVQLCRQTTNNPREESLRFGWELMCICLSFFPPSIKFQPYLESYISQHLDSDVNMESVGVSKYARHSGKRLERMSRCGAKKGVKKPTTDEVQQAWKSIYEQSMFGNTLEEILLLQAERYPERRLPWIQTMLSEEILRLNGAQTEGIFRVPGDIDEVNAMKVRCDRWIRPTDWTEPHTPASLLKLWYRELYEPLIPSQYYELCVLNCMEPSAALNIVQQLPPINQLVLTYLIRFLQVFAADENAKMTKMDVNNLAMVMAPNCLRCESQDPNVIFENTRKEMSFIRTLIQNLDTSYMDGIL